MHYRFFIGIALVVGLLGCSVKEPVNSDQSDGDTMKIVFEAVPFLDGDGDISTKTYVIPNDAYTSYDFRWSVCDTVGIYPDTGNQVYFTMEHGAGASSASFDGGAWTCKEGHVFRSYYPFIGDIYLDATKIPVSFTGQAQVGNANSDHFQQYDYMSTAPVSKTEGNLNFTYNHLITAVLPWAELPAGHYTGLTLSLDEPLFVTKGEYDLTADTPAIVGTEFSGNLHIDLDITFEAPDILKVFVPLAPMDMSGRTLTITIFEEGGATYQYTYSPSKAYVAGKIYRLRSSVSFAYPVAEAVDLGLSVKWASWNVGASAPEEYGDHFAWGETEPKTEYSWFNYKFRTSGDSWVDVKFNKYCTKNSYWDSSAPMDNKIALDSEDDAARTNWGGSWRMPTDAEWTELINNCTWTLISNYNGTGVAGRIVTSNQTGYTDKSIFLPAAGLWDGTSHDSVGSFGGYWSASLYTDRPQRAYGIYYNSTDLNRYGSYRYYGQSVRPVTE